MKDGGPAFPVPMGFDINGLTYPATHSEGMSLRDWFAGMALQGLLSLTTASGGKFEDYATDAYTIADAMIKEREK